jgi:hypothetical protein
MRRLLPAAVGLLQPAASRPARSNRAMFHVKQAAAVADAGESPRLGVKNESIGGFIACAGRCSHSQVPEHGRVLSMNQIACSPCT